MGTQIQGTGSVTVEEVYEKIKGGESLDKKMAYSHPEKTGGKSMRLSLGRIWFNELLPDDWPIVNEPVTHEMMDSIIKKFIKKYDPEKTADLIGDIQREAFKIGTLSPSSFSIDTFIPPNEWIILKKEFQDKWRKMPKEEMDIKLFTKEADKLSKMLVKHMDKSGFKIQNVMNSGAKGDPVQDWKALMLSKGFVLDIEGNIRGPIVEAQGDGYTPENYYNSAAQSRRTLYYKSTMTAKPGYLSRKVTMSNANIVIDTTRNDCRTRKYLELTVDSNNSKLLLNRYHIVKGEIKKIKDISDIEGKKIKLRSPVYCRAKKGICPICYGDHYKNLETKNIGILAGGAINMVAINSMMKLKHKSSQIEIIDVNFKNLIKSSREDLPTINKLIDIREKEIIAKTNCTILLDKSDYDESTLIDTGEEIFIPGIFNLYVGEISKNKFISLPFNFQVHLSKPEDYVVDGKTIVLRYAPGEKILSQDYYTKQTEPSVIDRILGGALKYINSPEALIDAAHEQLPSLDLIHIELVVSNMFRLKDDATVPCRLSNYKDFQIIGIKKLPHINSWLTGLSFEDPNKAIKLALINSRDNDMNPIEKILLEKFYDQEERNKRDAP